MAYTTCPLCDSDCPQVAYHVEDWLHGLNGSFRIVRCGHCNALYLNPRPEGAELARYYPSDYEAFGRRALGSEPPWRRALRLYGLDKRCRTVTNLMSGGRLLDVGCATGDFLARMRQNGSWQVTGLEMNEAAATQGSHHYGLEIRTGSVDEVEFAPRSFDVVTLWDVIEHLPQPKASLKRIANWLRPGGWVVVRTPDAGSLYARAFGRYWAGLDAPRHLVVFDRSSLNRLAAESGFEVKRVWTLSGSHALTVLSLRYWLRARGHSLGWSRLLGNPLAQVVTSPAFWLIDRLSGALVTMTARRLA